MRPTVGRIVHWRQEGRCLAAIVTDEGELDTVLGNVRLSVFSPTQQAPQMVTCAPYREDKTDYSWHWPEKAED